MASAYKWKITNSKYAYLTGGYTLNEYDANNIGTYPFISSENVDEDTISYLVNALSEDSYKTNYESMVGLIKEDEDGANNTILSYKYYYNVSTSQCTVIQNSTTQNYQSIGISSITQSKNNGINVISFNLTNGKSFNVVIYDGADGKDGEQGKTGEAGLIDVRYNDVDTTQIQSVIESMGLYDIVRDLSKQEFNENSQDIKDQLSECLSSLNTLIEKSDGTSSDVTAVYKNVQVYQENVQENNDRLVLLQDNISEISEVARNSESTVQTLTEQVEQGLERIKQFGVTLTNANDKFDEIYNSSIGYAERTSEIENGIAIIKDTMSRYIGNVDSLSEMVNNLFDYAKQTYKYYSGVTETSLTRLGNLETTVSAFTDNINVIDTNFEEIDKFLENMSEKLDYTIETISSSMEQMNENISLMESKFNSFSATTETKLIELSNSIKELKRES